MRHSIASRVRPRGRAGRSAHTALAWALGVVVLGVACGRAKPTPRERVLRQLRGDAVTVVVAEGPALAHPRLRGVLDVVASRWPASLGCVLATAFAGEQVALSVDLGGNITVLVATAGAPECPALSQREPGLWIATIGAGPSRATSSVLDDPRFARARPYLLASPIAGVSLRSDGARVMAAAQPEPLEAWIAIDAGGRAVAVEQAVVEQVAHMQRDPATAGVAARLHTSRAGEAQVIVRLDGPVDGDLAIAARTMLAWGERLARPTAPPFRCPPPAADPQAHNITCVDGTHYRVDSLASELASIVALGRPSPIVSDGLVVGLRLDAAVARLGLDAGDVVVAMNGRLVTSRAMLAERIARTRGQTTLTIRRGTMQAQLEVVER